MADELGFPDARRHDLLTAMSEAIMNAVVHASNGTLTISHDRNRIQVRVEDQGAGMPLDILPLATLQSGWSSKGTLGLGFTLISAADAVDMLTGPQGTIIVLTVNATRNSEMPTVRADAGSAQA
jgi:anti-sigma regulatory factor (Ser/Thr protein kinase)